MRGISWFHFIQCGIPQRGSARHDLFKGCFTTFHRHYYSFKIFPRIWLVKTTRIIHHNQPLLTKFEKNFVMLNRWRQNEVESVALLQVIELLTEKTWGRGWVVLVIRTKWRDCRGTFSSFHREILSKNMARTARRQLAGQHLLFGVYLQTWADLNLLNFPIQMHYRYELKSTEASLLLELFWRNNKTIIEFSFRRIWWILQIEEGVIRLGR